MKTHVAGFDKSFSYIFHALLPNVIGEFHQQNRVLFCNTHKHNQTNEAEKIERLAKNPKRE